MSDGVAQSAAERLRRRYPPPLLPRGARWAIGLVVVAGLIAGLVWIGVRHADPAVSAQVSGFTIVDDTAVTFTLTVQRPDPSVIARCRVIAQARDFETVGTREYVIPAGDVRLVELSESMRTFRRATSVSLSGCSH